MDPTVEPTDEELAGLMKRAFADLGERKKNREQQLQAQIDAARREVLAKLGRPRFSK